MILEGVLGRSAWPFLCRIGARLIAAIGCVAAEISRSGAAASAELDALRAQNGLRFEGLGFFCSPLRLHMNAVTSAINNAKPVIGMINPSVSIGKLLSWPAKENNVPAFAPALDQDQLSGRAVKVIGCLPARRHGWPDGKQSAEYARRFSVLEKSALRGRRRPGSVISCA